MHAAAELQVAGVTGLLPESTIEPVGQLPTLESLGAAAASTDIKVGVLGRVQVVGRGERCMGHRAGRGAAAAALS